MFILVFQYIFVCCIILYANVFSCTDIFPLGSNRDWGAFEKEVRWYSSSAGTVGSICYAKFSLGFLHPVGSQWLATTGNIAYSTHKVEFELIKKQKLTFKCHLPLESLLYQLKEIAYSVGQEAKNYFKVTFDNLNHRFFDFIKWHFQLVQSPKIS